MTGFAIFTQLVISFPLISYMLVNIVRWMAQLQGQIPHLTKFRLQLTKEGGTGASPVKGAPPTSSLRSVRARPADFGRRPVKLTANGFRDLLFLPRFSLVDCILYVTGCIFNAIQETVMFLILWPGPLLILLLFFSLNSYLLLTILMSRLTGRQVSGLLPKLRRNVAEVVLCMGGFLHNWSVEGFDNIPRTGGFMLVYHHGPVPVDYIYLVALIYVRTGRLVESVVDRSMLCLPGMRTLAQVMKCSAPNRDDCCKMLQEGRIVGVAPGGGKQAMFGSDWGRRRGYAVAAVAANVPVITVYTGNIEHAYSRVSWAKPIFAGLYCTTKVAVALIYGGLPLNLTTHIGPPVKAGGPLRALPEVKPHQVGTARVRPRLHSIPSTMNPAAASSTANLSARLANQMSQLDLKNLSLSNPSLADREANTLTRYKGVSGAKRGDWFTAKLDQWKHREEKSALHQHNRLNGLSRLHYQSSTDLTSHGSQSQSMARITMVNGKKVAHVPAIRKAVSHKNLSSVGLDGGGPSGESDGQLHWPMKNSRLESATKENGLMSDKWRRFGSTSTGLDRLVTSGQPAVDKTVMMVAAVEEVRDHIHHLREALRRTGDGEEKMPHTGCKAELHLFPKTDKEMHKTKPGNQLPTVIVGSALVNRTAINQSLITRGYGNPGGSNGVAGGLSTGDLLSRDNRMVQSIPPGAKLFDRSQTGGQEAMTSFPEKARQFNSMSLHGQSQSSSNGHLVKRASISLAKPNAIKGYRTLPSSVKTGSSFKTSSCPKNFNSRLPIPITNPNLPTFSKSLARTQLEEGGCSEQFSAALLPFAAKNALVKKLSCAGLNEQDNLIFDSQLSSNGLGEERQSSCYRDLQIVGQNAKELNSWRGIKPPPVGAVVAQKPDIYSKTLDIVSIRPSTNTEVPGEAKADIDTEEMKEKEVEELDREVRRQMEILKSRAERFESYGDCLQDWINQQSLDIQSGRLKKFLWCIIPSITFLITMVTTFRMVRFLLGDLLMVIIYKALLFSGNICQ